MNTVFSILSYQFFRALANSLERGRSNSSAPDWEYNFQHYTQNKVQDLKTLSFCIIIVDTTNNPMFSICQEVC